MTDPTPSPNTTYATLLKPLHTILQNAKELIEPLYPDAAFNINNACSELHRAITKLEKDSSL